MKPGEFGMMRERLIEDVAALTGDSARMIRRLPWAKLQLLAMRLEVL